MVDAMTVEEKIRYASSEEALELIQRLLNSLLEANPSVVQEALRTFIVSSDPNPWEDKCCMPSPMVIADYKNIVCACMQPARLRPQYVPMGPCHRCKNPTQRRLHNLPGRQLSQLLS